MNDTLPARDQAHADQLAASDPAVSAFVGASAGSGKTKLLTDRLLRLMLGGVRPERIQCLTFTKAAAAEMALRLQRTLGRWVTLDDAALDTALRDLDVASTKEARDRARALFAEVLDLPGGMRIGTIHAFCQSLLRRFPLEAALSPHFELADERDAEGALIEAREQMLARAAAPEMRAALAVLAGLATADQFGKHVAALLTDRDRLARARELGPELAAAQRRALGLAADTEAAVVAAGLCWSGEADLRRAAEHVQRYGSPKAQEKAAALLDWLGLGPDQRAEHWAIWREHCLTTNGDARKPGAFINPKLATTDPQIAATFQAEVERVLAVEDACRGLKMAEASHALVTLAGPVLDAYARRKDESGLLDYDDLIGHTRRLLIDPGAAWVLYKLDGGLDHLLLDEVQDTAPAQWRIAHALTQEFFSGAGAQRQERTVFAVGDRKQSIYSFQGADADEFDRSRALLGGRVRQAGKAWVERPLNVSFRSTEPVLALVDQVFADPLAAAGVATPGTLRHVTERSGHAGAVELWPLAPPPPDDEPPPWTVPTTNQGLKSAPQLLAETLAGWIARETDGSVDLPSRGRPLRPGDVMVLVRRRNDFARSLLRELKRCGVPTAGLDRLKLTEQPAVQDLLALCDALLLPQDDLAFACFLSSPLGGLTDPSLMELALDRPGPLWEALRTRAAERTDWRAAWDCFAALLARVDYATPHALLAEALGPLGGRTRLVRRLGPEADEPVDELLNAALAYAGKNVPSLQGFLHWLRRSGAEVKREQEAAGETVRIMTVHGAKGLQAPLVILPDTTALPPEDNTILWASDPKTGRDVPLWAPRKELRCAAGEDLRDAASARRLQEHNRLLYVALTRAEDRVLVCGWAPRKGVPDTCWYSLVQKGFVALDATAEPLRSWDGEVLRHAAPQLVAPRPEPTHDFGPPEPLPTWAGSAPDWRPLSPPAEPPRPEPLAPSRPEGVELGPVPAAASPLGDPAQRFRRGRLIHVLLQHLPELPPERRAAEAEAWLKRAGTGLNQADAAELAAETMTILAHPDLLELFGPRSRAEVPLSGMIGDRIVGGLVDRLAVLPDGMLVADFKTNRRAPTRAEDTPVTYLRQMAAYRAVLREVFPDRPVHCWLIWTHTAQVSPLPDALLARHSPSPCTTEE
jgi:ATP-dependent helicase/nuclease subunit A